MTREEAIKRIRAQKALCCVGCMHPQEIGYCENTCKLPEAYDTAIEALKAEPTHGRLIDADALSKKLCETTIFIKDGEVFQRMINDAPTVPVVDITQRDLCADISCTDCPFMQETCKLMDYVAYADRPMWETCFACPLSNCCPKIQGATNEDAQKYASEVPKGCPIDRPHGEWQDKEAFNETDDDHIVDEWQSARCSVCGKYHTTPYMYYFDNFNFCPNCGADMRGGGANE